MRADGKQVKDIDHMSQLMPYLMKERSDACNSITVKIPYEPMHRYINAARNNGHDLSYMSLIIAAFVRTVAKYPRLNRFVANKKVYARNELTVGMVVMRSDDAEGTMSKIKFDVTDTIFDISDKINKYVKLNRNEDSNSTDKLMGTLVKMPFIISLLIGLIKLGDKLGILPKALIDASPFHKTMVISNLASIRTNHIFHHIYNFGTVTSIVTIGNFEETPKMQGDKVVLEREIPLGIVLDERCCSGSYYGKCFREMLHYFRHPELLELPPEKVVLDY